MVWSNIPGANIHRAAEADNTQQRTEQAGVKRSTYPSVFSASVQPHQPSRNTPFRVILRDHRLGDQSGGPEKSSGLLKSKTIGDNTVVRFNNQYCPELGAAMALARQEVFGSHPVPGSSDLISSRPSNKVFETFTDVPRLVDTLSLLRRHAPSAPLHHFPHGFGSLRTVRPNMSSPAPGWHYYGENKAVNTTDCPESVSAPAPRAVTNCPVAHPHQQSQAVQTQSVSAPMPPEPQGAWREQESSPVNVPAGSYLDSSAMLQHLQQQLQQQQDELEARAAAKGPDRASVGCQTRQGDSWRVQSEGCMGNSGQESGSWADHDKAWVPTGTHFLDKQAHEALTPKHPPNSPQGNKCLSPRRRRSPGQGRAAATSPAKPAWDSSPSQAAPCSPGASPTRAQLKKMTVSWSPGRKGFVKPELAQNRDDGFSLAHKHADIRTKHSSKLKKKGSPRKARSGEVPTNATFAAPKPAKTSSGGSIWEGKLAGPSSFLQPILHSQSSKMSPDVNQSPGHHEQHDSPKPAKKNRRPSSSSRSRRHAHKPRGQSESDDGTSGTEGHAQNSPPMVFTLGQSPRGSYVSPLKGSSRRSLPGRLALQSVSPHPASSAPAQSPPSPAQSSQLRPQCSVGYSAHSSRLSIQDSDMVECSPSEVTSEPESSLLDELGLEGSGLLDGLGLEEGKEPSCDCRSFNSGPAAKKGAGRKLFGHQNTKHTAEAGSVTSSGLRREVQDSLSELERLIEQQHRQLIARGILLPEDPSSGSVSASDLDFSNLSLDSGMDRLSRLADSLAEGATPSSLIAQDAQLDFSIPAVSQHLPAGRSDSAAAAQQAADTHTHHVGSESAAESAWQQSDSDRQMHSREDPKGSGHLHYDTDTRAHPHRQTAQMHASQPTSFRPACDMASSAHPSDAMGQSPGDTASLCQHSLPSIQRRCSTSQHSNACGSIQSRRRSGAVVNHAVLGDDAAAVGKQAQTSQCVLDGSASEPGGAATYLLQEVSERDDSASQAEASQAAAEQTESAQHCLPSRTEDAASQDSLPSSVGQRRCSADLAQGSGADVAQHARREGLLSDSEEEFENSIFAARQLRPVNMTQAATRSAATCHTDATQSPATFGAQCTVTMASADGQAAAFSTIFRQTPTDLTVAEAEEKTQIWEEELSHDGQSEYSGDLSEEPSAAHWAEMYDTPLHVAQ